jgi:putative DNA primase/helicase
MTVRVVDFTDREFEVRPPTFSDESLALRFADRHEADFRYVAAWGKWFHYGGSCWKPDDTLHAFDHARRVCREAAAEAKSSKLAEAKKAKLATALASSRTVAAVERLAKSDRRLAATSDRWDACPWFFNAAGEGDISATTFDLKTGIGRVPNKLDYITKRTACSAAPAGTPHPLWTAFLDRVTGQSVELQSFLQRYVGYCSTGFTTEHVFVFAYGTGANGKSTFINTIAKVFGDYTTVADMNTFLTSNSERHPTDLAKLHGARLVIAQETQKGRKWDETKIKALTGGDKITARFMRQDFFDFQPTFKLFIAGNHKPRLSTVDEAMHRRLLIVPFTEQIPPSERDPDLPRKLEAEWPAILRWCIDGCLEWQRIGLVPPAIVLATTEEYFAEQDTFGQWLEDRVNCKAGEFAFTSSAELFTSWKQWCEGQNLKPGSERSFADALKDKGFHKTRRNYARGFAGIALNGR